MPWCITLDIAETTVFELKITNRVQFGTGRYMQNIFKLRSGNTAIAQADWQAKTRPQPWGDQQDFAKLEYWTLCFTRYFYLYTIHWPLGNEPVIHCSESAKLADSREWANGWFIWFDMFTVYFLYECVLSPYAWYVSCASIMYRSLSWYLKYDQPFISYVIFHCVCCYKISMTHAYFLYTLKTSHCIHFEHLDIRQ